MALHSTKSRIVLSGNCGAEDAESLYEWLSANPKGQIVMADVTHLHTACVQAIATTANKIAKPPVDPFCAILLQRLARL